MSDRSELIFLTGPDAGRRIRLEAFPVLMGRGGSCGIRMADKYASREQIELSDSPDGVVLENLSDRGTEINGKTYKRKKRVLLGTGDVLKIGLDTQILFVQAGDDSEQAIAAAQQTVAASEPAPEPAPLPVQEPQPVEPPRPARAFKTLAELEAERSGKKTSDAFKLPSALQPDQVDKLAARKRKRLMIGLGIYLAVMAIGALALAKFAKRTQPAEGMPELLVVVHEVAMADGKTYNLLKDEYLPKVDSVPRPADQAATMELAREHLSKARLYAERTTEPGSRYECIRNFDLYRHYSGRSTLESLDDQVLYDKCLRDLSLQVDTAYGSAWSAVNRQDWKNAKQQFEAVLDELARDGQNPLYVDVARRLQHVARADTKGKGKSSPGWM